MQPKILWKTPQCAFLIYSRYMFDHPDDDSIVLLEEDWISIALAEVCKALQYLHTSGWVHRDVCASNIVLNSDGHIKLADYQTVAVEKPEVPAGESVCVSIVTNKCSECLVDVAGWRIRIWQKCQQTL